MKVKKKKYVRVLSEFRIVKKNSNACYYYNPERFEDRNVEISGFGRCPYCNVFSVDLKKHLCVCNKKPGVAFFGRGTSKYRKKVFDLLPNLDTSIFS